jgi:hypothetical protein
MRKRGMTSPREADEPFSHQARRQYEPHFYEVATRDAARPATSQNPQDSAESRVMIPFGNRRGRCDRRDGGIPSRAILRSGLVSNRVDIRDVALSSCRLERRLRAASNRLVHSASSSGARAALASSPLDRSRS